MKIKLMEYSFPLFRKGFLKIVMKIFIFLCCTVVFGLGPKPIFSQNADIVINEKQTLTVKQLLKLIHKQTDYRFIFSNSLIEEAPKITLEKGTVKADRLLENALEPLGLTYMFTKDSTIHVKKRPMEGLGSLIDLTGRAQFSVTGTIVDQEGVPLSGANIIEKGTTNGVTADFDGNFSLNVANGNAVLVVSYIGFATKEVAVNGQSTVNVQLEESAAGLDEVVVVGYGTQAKKDVTGAITQVGSDEYKEQPVTRVDQILQGRAAGVNVTNSSGAPGGTVSIRIRGANSINGSNEPLYVVDGFVGANFNDVNPTDIQSLQVLKDASATAIYGSRGSNGVVLITTKTGRKGKPQLTFTTRGSVSNLINEWDLMDAATFAQVVNERATVFGQPAKFTQSQIDSYRTNGGTDWQDELFRTGYGQEYQLDYSGGSENVSYFISGNYLNQNGIVVNSDYTKFGLRTNVTTSITDKLTASIKMNYNRRESNNVSGSGNTSGALAGPLTWAPTTPARDENGLFTLSDPISSIMLNPLELAYNDNISEINTVVSNGSLNYDFFEGLSLNVAFGLSYSNSQFEGFYANRRSNDPSASRESRESLFLQNTNNLTYKKTFNDKHSLTLTGVLENQSRKVDGFGTNANHLLYPNFKYDNLTLVGSSSSYALKSKETIVSYIGRLNYEYDSKYLLTASVRSDGSSKFRGDNQYSTFPSVALGWRISEENFMNGGFFDELKLRASWGETGSQAIQPYGTVTTLDTSNENAAASFTNGILLPGIVIGNPGNPDLRWETTSQLDFGLDMQIFNNRLGIIFDYYQKSTTDLLLNQPLPKYVGGGQIAKNVGEVDNEGYELGINATIIDNGNFQWNSTFNVAFLKNEIIDLGDQEIIFIDGGVGAGLTNLPENVLTPGHSLSSYWGLKYLGTWKSNEAAEAAEFGNVPGDSRYEDLNGDKVIGGDDYQIIGQGMPKATYGWNNTLSYKNFTLNFFFNAMTGYDKWDFGYATGVMPNADAREATHVDVLDRWVSGTNENSDIPHFSPTTVDEAQSSRFIEKGDFVRLKNLSFSYDIPKDILRGIGVQVMLSGTNLWTLTDYKGLDPEAFSNNGIGDAGGGDAGSYPNSKTWTIGINLNF